MTMTTNETALQRATEMAAQMLALRYGEKDPEAARYTAEQIIAIYEEVRALAHQPGDVELSDAPCSKCGYNGPGYYQPNTHPCAATSARSDWQLVSSAPRDGTKIVIGNAKWSAQPTAHWGDYPGNPVEDEDGKESWMQGWVIEDDTFCAGCDDGFLGWDEDVKDGAMPTHWMPLPKPPTTGGASDE